MIERPITNEDWRILRKSTRELHKARQALASVRIVQRLNAQRGEGIGAWIERLEADMSRPARHPDFLV